MILLIIRVCHRAKCKKFLFIRALIGDVDILLLDESTANLDQKSRELIFDILKKQKISIINSTHDPESFENIDHRLKIEIKDDKRKLIFD